MRTHRTIGPVEQYLRDLRGVPVPADVLALLAPARRRILEPTSYVFAPGREAWIRASRRLRGRRRPAGGQSSFKRRGRSR